MNLTPADVESKAFTQALRGYQMDEVDDFLDEVMTTLKAHEQRLREAQDRIRSLESDMASRGGDESTISRAFLAAQRSADALIADAEAQAARIKRDAEAESSRLIEDRDSQRNNILEEINSMRAAVAAVKARLSDLTGSVSTDMAAMESTLKDAENEVRAPSSSPSEEPSSGGPSGSDAVPGGLSPGGEESVGDKDEDDPASSTQGDLPEFDLTEDSPTRVSARPWERG